jgi:hypothetical protein
VYDLYSPLLHDERSIFSSLRARPRLLLPTSTIPLPTTTPFISVCDLLVVTFWLLLTCLRGYSQSSSSFGGVGGGGADPFKNWALKKLSLCYPRQVTAMQKNGHIKGHPTQTSLHSILCPISRPTLITAYLWGKCHIFRNWEM